MVKGCERRVLHLKNPDSGLFEEAFFFLKNPSPAPGCGAEDMVAEANRILLGCREAETSRRPRKRRAAFFLGALIGAATAVATLLVIGLIV